MKDFNKVRNKACFFSPSNKEMEARCIAEGESHLSAFPLVTCARINMRLMLVWKEIPFKAAPRLPPPHLTSKC